MATGGLERTGIELVAEGSAAFLGAITQAQNAVTGFNRTTSQAGGGLESMTTGSTALAVALGQGLFSGIQTAIGGIENFISKSVESASTLMDVKINVESLTAAEILQSGAAKDMSEAIAMAGPVAQDVMDKLKTLSLASPFEYRQILSAYQLNKAFGMNTESALDLTKAETNLGAVNKTIPNVIERVAYSLGQMNAMNRIGGQEMRELQQAGVNLSKVLQEELGMSVDEANAALQSGKITFEDVGKAISTYVDKYFGDAAQKASRTWSGLLSSFSDLQFFASTDLIGGAMQSITNHLGNLFDKTQAFIQAGGLKPIGAGIEVVTEELMTLAENGFTAGQNFIDQFGGQMMSAADSALSWGWNIVTQLATGIMDGAASALSAAMDFISSMLSFFLSPGSPPRVAPEIDKWGAEAMGQFLGGFTSANFDVLKGAESGIQSALSALVGGGLMDDKTSKGLFQSLSKGLAGAIGGQTEMKPVLDAVRASLGDYGVETANLIEKQLALAAATNKVQAAQEALNKAQEDASKANEDLVRITDEYNALARAGASPKVLAAKRAEFENAKQRRTEAIKAATQAQKDLDTSKKEADGLKDKVDLQKQVLDQLIELTKQEKEVDKAAKEKKPRAGGMPKAGAAGAVKPPDLSKVSDAMQKKMEELKETIRGKLSDAFAPLKEAWDKAMAKLSPAWERFKSVISELWQKYVQPAAQQLGKLIPPDLVTNIGRVIGVIGVGVGIFTAFSVVVGIVGSILGAINWPLVLIVGALALLYTAWTNNWGGIQTILTNAWTTIQPVLQNIVEWLGEKLKANIAFAIQQVTWLSNTWTTVLLPAIQTVWGWLSGTFLPFLFQFASFFAVTLVTIIAFVATVWEFVLLPAIRLVWSFVSTILYPLLVSLANFLIGIFTANVNAVINQWQNILLPVLTAVWSFISGKLFPLFQQFGGFLGGLFTSVTRTLAGVWKNSLQPALMSVWTAVSVSLQPLLKEFSNWMSGTFGPVIQTIIDLWDTVKRSLSYVIDYVNQAYARFKALAEYLLSMWNVIPPWLRSHSPPPLAEGLNYISDALADLNHQGFPSFQRSLNKVDLAGQRAFGADAIAAKLNLMAPQPAQTSVEKNYNLNMTSNWQPSSVSEGFEYFRLRAS